MAAVSYTHLRARGHQVHAHADLAELGRLLLGELHQRRLRGAVGDPQGAGAQAGDRADVDHRPAAGLGHDAGGRLDHQERAVQVDGEHPRPFLVAGVEQRLEHRDAGVVHDRVDPPEPLDRGGDAGRHLRRVGNVAGQGQRPVGGQGRLCRGQGLGVDVQQRDVPAVRLEPLRRRQPDPARSTRDDRHLRGHGLPLSDIRSAIGVTKRAGRRKDCLRRRGRTGA